MAQISFRGNELKSGNNKPKQSTVKIALPTKILSPNPTGNMVISGTKISNAGIDISKFK